MSQDLHIGADRIDLTAGIAAIVNASSTPEGLESTIERLGVATQYPTVLELTQRLFPGRLEVSVDEDPEIAGDVRIVLTVSASGSFERVLDNESQWCARLCELDRPAATIFRLSIVDDLG